MIQEKDRKFHPLTILCRSARLRMNARSTLLSAMAVFVSLRWSQEACRMKGLE